MTREIDEIFENEGKQYKVMEGVKGPENCKKCIGNDSEISCTYLVGIKGY